MVLIVHTRNLTISCFISTHRRTVHRKLSKSSQIPSLKDCRKNFSNQEIFNTAKVEYQDVLKKSGYNVDLKYTNNKSEKPKTRKRNITWFNRPFSKSASTNVAKTFLQLVAKHFPRSHKLYKIFNTVIQLQLDEQYFKTNQILKPRDQRPKCSCRKKNNVQWKGAVKLTT